MLPAVDPNPVEPIVLLVEAAAALVVEAPGVEAVIRSEKRFVEPRVAPRLAAVELELVAPEVSEEEEVLVLAFVDTIADVEAAMEVEPAATFETFELELREDIRLPLMLPRSPLSRGAIIATKRSA